MSPGFTLVEVVVAVLLLTVGLAGLAGTAATVSRMVALGRRDTDVAFVAARRLEMLHATDCALLSAGVAVAGPLEERWIVVPHVGGALALEVVVRSATSRGVRADSFTSARLCW